MTPIARMNRITLTALMAQVALSAGGAAHANPANCATRDMVVERLARVYGETRQSIGLGTNNQLMEVYASDASGSWTITFTTAEGLTCLIASGQGFETMIGTQAARDPGA